MKRPVTHWYTKDQPIFENTDDMIDTRIDVTRIPGGADTPPCLKISHNTFETMEKANWEFLRLSLPVICQTTFISEQEKSRRWEEVRIRQHRLIADVEQQTPAHIDHMMKSGFTMSDIKGLHRNYSEDGVEADEQMVRPNPSRPPRKGSMSRGYDSPPGLEVNGQAMGRSNSEMDMQGYEEGGDKDDKKKRGRSPFRFFSKKNRDQSKDKLRSKTPEGDGRGQGRNVVQSSGLMARTPTVRISNVSKNAMVCICSIFQAFSIYFRPT
jgi:ryanodine receptor 2